MSVSRPAAVIVLAAGEGTRMKSKTPKVLHSLCGRTVLGHALATAQKLRPERLIVVVGHNRDQVQAHIQDQAPEAQLVVQEHQYGTGHAVRMVTEATGPIQGPVVVTYGDVPLLTAETLKKLVQEHTTASNAATVLTARVPDPTGYGRIIRDTTGAFKEIVEHADATEEQRKIDEMNSGFYAFDGTCLADAIKRLPTTNKQGHEYLTDVVAILREDGHRVGAVQANDPQEVEGINDRVQLARARRVCNDRLLTHWMREGVTIVDPQTTWIDAEVTLEQDVELRPGTQLEGHTHIKAGAKIGPNCVLRDTQVAEDAELRYTVCDQAEIGPGATVGPFAYLRQGTKIGPNAHIGTSVELKNATVGEGSKVPHLSYVGDADIGEHSNIGAATIFANYDGVAKHHTTVGDHVRIGSDTILVAPVNVGDGAYTAAGSAIHQDVPPGALGIARGEQHNSEDWVERRRPGTKSAAAAERAKRKSGGEKNS